MKAIETLIYQLEPLTELEASRLNAWYWEYNYSTSARVQERRTRAYTRLEQERDNG